MQGRNWKLAMLLAATVGVMSASSLAIAQTDAARQQPQGLRDGDAARQQPQGLKDAQPPK
jgi:hypothetical protein